MTTNLLPNTRALIARSRFQTELSEFASWLFAEHYTPLAVHRHLTRLDAALPRIPCVNGSRVHAAGDGAPLTPRGVDSAVCGDVLQPGGTVAGQLLGDGALIRGRRLYEKHFVA